MLHEDREGGGGEGSERGRTDRPTERERGGQTDRELTYPIRLDFSRIKKK